MASVVSLETSRGVRDNTTTEEERERSTQPRLSSNYGGHEVRRSETEQHKSSSEPVL